MLRRAATVSARRSRTDPGANLRSPASRLPALVIPGPQRALQSAIRISADSLAAVTIGEWSLLMAFARRAQRAAGLADELLRPLLSWMLMLLLKGVAVALLSVVAAMGAFTFYWIIYWLVIPGAGSAFPAYFEYRDARSTGAACATVHFAGPQWDSPLVTRNEGWSSIGSTFIGRAAHSVEVDASMSIPLAPDNLALGPVMLELTMYSNVTAVARSARPYVFSYRSYPRIIVEAVLWMVPHILGWRSEEDVVVIPLLEGFHVDEFPLTRATLCLSPALAVKHADLVIRAEATGIRGVLQRHPTFACFIVVCTTFVAIASALLLLLLALPVNDLLGGGSGGGTAWSDGGSARESVSDPEPSDAESRPSLPDPRPRYATGYEPSTPLTESPRAGPAPAPPGGSAAGSGISTTGPISRTVSNDLASVASSVRHRITSVLNDP